MFIYYYIDKYGIKTTVDFAFDRDLEYLESKVKNGQYKELVIEERVF